MGGYMYSNFFKLLIFYAKKKLDIKRSLTGFQVFIIIWTIGISLLKISQILIILTWATYFQLASLPRSRSDVLVIIVFQKIYIPLCDFLVTLSFLYFFYQQKKRIEAIKRGSEVISKSMSKFLSLRDVSAKPKNISLLQNFDNKSNFSMLNGDLKENLNV